MATVTITVVVASFQEDLLRLCALQVEYANKLLKKKDSSI
jgi:hypothetical protein